MRIAAIIVGALLGFAFVASGVVMLFNLAPMPPPPADTPAGAFFAAFGPTGYLTFVKVLEVIGGILVAIPRTRRVGLLVLGPIIVNIIAYHAFVAREGVFAPPFVVICLFTFFLVWVERAAFAAFLGFRSQPATATTNSVKVSETETVAS